MASSAALRWCMLFRWTALRGAEASSDQSGVFVGFVRLSFVLPGLVFCLSLILELSSPWLYGPLGSDPAFHVVAA